VQERTEAAFSEQLAVANDRLAAEEHCARRAVHHQSVIEVVVDVAVMRVDPSSTSPDRLDLRGIAPLLSAHNKTSVVGLQSAGRGR
jgi:hypothetical protein